MKNTNSYMFQISPIPLLMALVFFLFVNFLVISNLFTVPKAQAKINNQNIRSKKNTLLYTQIPIWGFHDLVDKKNKENNPPYRREFDSDYYKHDLAIFLEYLLQNNYWFLSTQDFYDYFLTNSKSIPEEYKNKKPIMITFDDGYKGIKNNLLPLLSSLEKKYNQKIKVVLFVNPALMLVVDNDLVYLSCDDLKEGFYSGFYDIQSHGLSHLKLTEINIEKLIFELSKAKFVLKKCINDKSIAKHLAYPNGAYNEKVEEYTKQYYSSAYNYNNKATSLKPKEKFYYRINRYQAYKGVSPEKLIQITEKIFQN